MAPLLGEFWPRPTSGSPFCFSNERRPLPRRADGSTRASLSRASSPRPHAQRLCRNPSPTLRPDPPRARFENLLDAIRSGRAPLTDASVDTCEMRRTRLHSSSLVSHGEVSSPELPHAIFHQLQHTRARRRSHRERNKSTPHHPPLCPEEIARVCPRRQRQLSGLSAKARAHWCSSVVFARHVDEHFSRSQTPRRCGRSRRFRTQRSPDEAFSYSLHNACPREELESRLAPLGAKVAGRSMWRDRRPHGHAARRLRPTFAASNSAHRHATSSALPTLPRPRDFCTCSFCTTATRAPHTTFHDTWPCSHCCPRRHSDCDARDKATPQAKNARRARVIARKFRAWRSA